MPYECECRGQGDAFMSKEMPKIASKPSAARRKAQERCSPHSSQKELTLPTPSFWTSVPPELQDNKCLCLNHSVCGTSLPQP